MTDPATIKIINAARDVLVGKVPDPKAQVEQITTAMMYKFMDDMDLESVKLGGVKSFFVGEYEDYSWTNLFNPKFSAQKKYDLYCEAIKNLQKNPNFPQLFRNMLKGAFLPYTDPRTLRLFLAQINQFTYDHSENLGCAFEYLLSILGSQGDAGQFRTPRHIIDFMVEVIDPKKDETILDPACGTAGFLISAYKHILKMNSKPNQKKIYQGELLEPFEKEALTKNIHGYDISPEMVKLSLVNLFLHKFPNPEIHEYDTLTSQRKWNDNFDIIFANPPFMTPKGGIQPHDKFSVRAKRAEVLFVSYIAEHLKINGRAGIVVPEGIIFQSANAYKELRKMLVENWGLYAVVSLPSGVFQPYSGVKTSILLIDQKLVKITKNILFIKIENDGFNLGAQRREINQNDLPEALEILKQWKTTNKLLKSNIAYKVLKTEIMKNDSYSFIAERYLKTVDINNCKWPMMKLDSLLKESKIKDLEKNINKRITVTLWQNGIFKRKIKKEIINKKENTKYFERKFEQFIYGKHNLAQGAFGLISKDLNGFCSSADNPSFDINKKLIIPIFLIKILSINYDNFKKYETGTGSKRVGIKKFLNYKIPVPTLAVQKQIVEEIESYQKVIDGAKQAVENWKPSFKIDLKWPMMKLNKISKIERGNFITKKTSIFGDIPVIAGGKKPAYFHNKYNRINQTITISASEANAGFINYFEIPIFASDCLTIKSNDKNKISTKFLFYSLFLKQNEIYKLQTGMAQPHVYVKDLAKIKIPLPPLSIQKQIVKKIEAEEKIINNLKFLIEKMEEKIRIKIEEVWKDN